jgi:uncharacterized protein YlxW (UPF0749 family)
MDDNVKWIIGLCLTLAGAVGAMCRYVWLAIEEGDDALHERINSIKDEYVRRNDMDAQVSRLEAQFRDLRQDVKDGQKATTDRLDALLVAVNSRKP